MRRGVVMGTEASQSGGCGYGKPGGCNESSGGNTPVLNVSLRE